MLFVVIIALLVIVALCAYGLVAAVKGKASNAPEAKGEDKDEAVEPTFEEEQRLRKELDTLPKTSTINVMPEEEIKTSSFVVENGKAIYLDTETTGFSPDTEELLQLAIIDYDGTVLYNSYFKPEHKTSWPEAQRVNHISPKMVANAPSFASEKETIQAIIDKASIVLAYNISFDKSFLDAGGIVIPENKHLIDVMWTVYRYVRFANRKLSTVAAGLGYTYDNVHDSLGDTLATKYVFDNVNTAEKKWLLGTLQREKAKELYGKDHFQYKNVKYDAYKDWDAFITGCQLKIQEKGSV